MLDRGAGVDEPVPCTQLLGEGVGDLAETVEDELHGLLQLPAGDRARGRIDRDGQFGVRLHLQPRRVGVLEELVIGVGELLDAFVDAHLAREDALPSGLQVAHTPRLVEEGQRHLAVAVADHDLEQRPVPVLHTPLADAAHLGDDGHRLAERQC